MGCATLSLLQRPPEDDKLPDAVSRDNLVYSHNYSPQLTCILSLISDKERIINWDQLEGFTQGRAVQLVKCQPA